MPELDRDEASASKSFGGSTAVSVEGMTIGDYLIRRLLDYGIRDIFGIPGDYVLTFYADLEESPINTTGLNLIHVHLRQDDFSQPLTRLGQRLRKRV
jgi:TPP-dependent 2-oxoacid decarboxylase